MWARTSLLVNCFQPKNANVPSRKLFPAQTHNCLRLNSSFILFELWLPYKTGLKNKFRIYFAGSALIILVISNFCMFYRVIYTKNDDTANYSRGAAALMYFSWTIRFQYEVFTKKCITIARIPTVLIKNDSFVEFWTLKMHNYHVYISEYSHTPLEVPCKWYDKNLHDSRGLGGSK